MNNLQQSNLEQLTVEILVYKQQTAVNIIEIGRRLIQVKELVPHGEWGKWLKERAEFSHRVANRFMQAAKEFSNSPALTNLPPTKVFALLDLPADEREGFALEPHQLPTGETKTIDEMTTRELQEAIKARKAAEKAAADAQKEVERLTSDNTELRQANKELAEPRKPEVIEKEVEVVPLEIQEQLASAKTIERQYNILATENKRLKFELEAKKDPADSRLEMESKVSTFTGRIKFFLREMAPLGYLGQEVMRSTPRAQQEYENAISALEKWCRDMRDAMIRPEKSKIIDVEVG